MFRVTRRRRASSTQLPNIGFARPHNPSTTSRYLLYLADDRSLLVRKSSRSQERISTFRELATAPVMRITSDLHQRSRKKSLHTFREIFCGPPFFNFPPYFFKVAAFPKCHYFRYKSLETTPLEVLSGSETTPNRFYVKFRSRSKFQNRFLQKIFSENPKNLSGHFPNPSRKKNPD